MAQHLLKTCSTVGIVSIKSHCTMTLWSSSNTPSRVSNSCRSGPVAQTFAIQLQRSSYRCSTAEYKCYLLNTPVFVQITQHKGLCRLCFRLIVDNCAGRNIYCSTVSDITDSYNKLLSVEQSYGCTTRYTPQFIYHCTIPWPRCHG